jgi:ribosome-binding factor A
LRLRYTPELHFVYDQTTENAARIEQILKEESEKLREQELESAQPSPVDA